MKKEIMQLDGDVGAKEILEQKSGQDIKFKDQ